MINNITIEIRSIRNENGIDKLPEVIQLNRLIVSGLSMVKNKLTDIINEARTISEAMIPAEEFLNKFFPNPINKNPKSGKTGINQAKFSISKNRGAKV